MSVATKKLIGREPDGVDVVANLKSLLLHQQRHNGLGLLNVAQFAVFFANDVEIGNAAQP